MFPIDQYVKNAENGTTKAVIVVVFWRLKPIIKIKAEIMLPPPITRIPIAESDK